ncbi:VQ motif-containing protein 25-like [Panicum miliaceum]|uniref:VQ motif-containing protein 25-like n=1 Tax=Panicum miliaceum TaxID=4540 RepID=A0A3L6Q573_PANMI|nr:VQ motif-containing protein 25-like [Panicum miliaceum]
MKHAAKLPSRGSASSSPATSAHRLSHSIAKEPPRKIRIIHVLAPEVIKTEARHFRELVQRLTGKPSPNGSGAAASTEDASSSSPPPQDSCDSSARDEGPAAGIELKVKEEPETSSGDEGGGFLRALELDGCNDMFFQGLQDFLFSSCDMESGFNF